MSNVPKHTHSEYASDEWVGNLQQRQQDADDALAARVLALEAAVAAIDVRISALEADETVPTLASLGLHAWRDGFVHDRPEVVIEPVPDPDPTGPVLAFPGAVGHAAHVKGGRGGELIVVDLAATSGPTSWAAACAASGPRTVVFKRGGRAMSLPKATAKPDLTILGQTATGTVLIPGVALANNSLFGSNTLARYLTIRGGSDVTGTHSDAEGQYWDHCSMSWGTDEVFTFFGHVDKVTAGWCIVSEGLMSHSMGVLLGGSEGGMEGVTLARTLLAFNNERNPRIQGTLLAEVINVLVYGWGVLGLQADKGVIARQPTIDVIGSVWKAASYSSKTKHLRIDDGDLYLRDVLTPARTSDAQDDWDAIPTQYRGNGVRHDSPIAASDVPVTGVVAARDLEALLLPTVGASRFRDAVDARVIAQVAAGTGGLLTAQPAWPTIDPGPGWTDRIVPGMDDAWVEAHGVTSHDQVMPSGYTAVEEWASSLA